MAKEKTCPRKKNLLAPCYITDGEVALDSKGKCGHCGLSPEEIEKAGEKQTAKVTPEQESEIKRLNREVNAFAKEMKSTLAEKVIAGKKGWDTDPAWSFRTNIESNLAEMDAGKNVEDACVDVANLCMFIHRRAK